MSELKANAFDWQTAINETYQEFSQQVISYAPQIIGVIALLVLGYFSAHLLRVAAQKLVQGFDALFKRAARNDDIKREQIKRSYSRIVGKFVFWAVFVFFIAASANLLGWKMFTSWMDSLVGFLPSLISGVLIILGGFLISNVARSGIMSTNLSTGMAQSNILARVAQLVILFSAVIIGMEQIGLNVHFLTSVIVVIVGIILAGAALAFSMGAKTMVANIIGAQHTRKHCSVGEHMKIGDYEGDVLEVTQTSIVLDTLQGRAVVPAKYFHEKVTLLNPETLSDNLPTAKKA